MNATVILQIVGPVLAVLAIVQCLITRRSIYKARSVALLDREFVFYSRLLAEALNVARQRHFPVDDWLTEAAARMAERDAQKVESLNAHANG